MELRAYSANTIYTRRRLLEAFALWCEGLGITKPSEVNLALVESYQRYLYRLPGRGQRPRMSAGYHVAQVGHIRAFFQWLLHQKLTAYDPTAAVETPRIERRLPRTILTVVQVEQLMAVPDLSKAEGLMGRAALELLYATGLRSYEATNLQLPDIDRPERMLLVRLGKGKKDRYAPYSERAGYWLDRYLNDARPLLVANDTVQECFVHQGSKMAQHILSHYVKRCLHKAGLPSGQGASHLLRHACATHMLHNGADIRSIQELLGHKDLSSTQIYTRVTLTDLRRVHAKTHPLSGL